MMSHLYTTIFYDYTLRVVIAGTAVLGITTGALGCFAFLRKQSLLGDAISHAAFPGIALMFLATYTKNPLLLMIGGALTGGISHALCQNRIESQ